MDEILRVLARLASLLEQYDSSENGVAQLEMQNEGLYRMTSEFEKDVNQAKGSVNKALRQVLAQRDAYKRAVEDITGLSPENLRDKLQEIKLALSRAEEYSIEEKRIRGAFEILVAADAFGDDPGETRPDFESRLSNLRQLKDVALRQLVKVVDSAINKQTIVGATDSVLSQLKNRSVAPTSTLVTI
mgnify:CR=1 FL=1